MSVNFAMFYKKYLVRLKCICVLGWIGLNPAEIVGLKKSELQPIDNIGYKISTPRGEYGVFGKIFGVIENLLHLQSYKGYTNHYEANEDSTAQKSTRRIHLIESEYLFAPAVKGVNEEFTKGSFWNEIYNFNKVAAVLNTGRAIVFGNLYKNAMFSELYYYGSTDELSDNELRVKIQETFKCNPRTARVYRKQYQRFVRDVRNKKI